jgi:hypothetical protein
MVPHMHSPLYPVTYVQNLIMVWGISRVSRYGQPRGAVLHTSQSTAWDMCVARDHSSSTFEITPPRNARRIISRVIRAPIRAPIGELELVEDLVSLAMKLLMADEASILHLLELKQALECILG